ncbi:hypothetical protein UFOVP139_10 [uncultured Caudovirales phage]|uniref:Uncharacterized protein n=1 Tax=uncultured Caudovirales phage TaxID=2100421 RepID=A0A6J5LDX8_9CAUD|nr:hypothetical protein UFOVP139_10 [uncultured Caudovirales phage]
MMLNIHRSSHRSRKLSLIRDLVYYGGITLLPLTTFTAMQKTKHKYSRRRGLQPSSECVVLSVDSTTVELFSLKEHRSSRNGFDEGGVSHGW